MYKLKEEKTEIEIEYIYSRFSLSTSQNISEEL
jgi:hypothetical protein